MSGAPEGPVPRRLIRDGMLVLGLVLGVLASTYGALVAAAFAPGAGLRAALLTAAADVTVALALWRLLAVGPRFRPFAGALSAMLAVPGGAFLGTALVLLSHPDNAALPSLRDVVELSMFMVRFTVVHLGILTLPVAGAAGYGVTRWCEGRRRSFAAFA